MRALKVLKMLALALGLGLPAAPASAFTAADFTNSISSLGSCTLQRSLDGSVDYAVTSIYGAGIDDSYAGGSFFAFGSLGSDRAITKAAIATCLGTEVSNVGFLVQNGADGTYETDTYVGFRFTLLTPAGGLEAGQHH